MKKTTFATILIFVMTFLFNESFSQVINVESARMQSDTTGWMGSAGAGFSTVKNTKDVLTVEMAAHIQYKSKKNKDLWLLLGSYGFQRGGNENFENNSYGHLRYNHKVTPWLRWEAFTQLQNNLQTQIDSRFLVGTGPRFKIISTDVFHLYTAVLFMYEREREHTKPVVMHNNIRNSSYVSFTILPNKGVEIISTTYYQPLVNKLSDWRILNQATMRIKSGRHFRFSLVWNYLHDRFPAGTAPHTTYSLKTGIEYAFSQKGSFD